MEGQGEPDRRHDAEDDGTGVDRVLPEGRVLREDVGGPFDDHGNGPDGAGPEADERPDSARMMAPSSGIRPAAPAASSAISFDTGSRNARCHRRSLTPRKPRDGSRAIAASNSRISGSSLPSRLLTRTSRVTVPSKYRVARAAASRRVSPSTPCASCWTGGVTGVDVLGRSEASSFAAPVDKPL